MFESTISKQGQTTILKPVRESLGLRPGDRVRYVIVEGAVRILPVRPIDRLFGKLRHEGNPVSIDQMEQAAVEGATETE